MEHSRFKLAFPPLYTLLSRVPEFTAISVETTNMGAIILLPTITVVDTYVRRYMYVRTYIHAYIRTCVAK